MKNPSPPTSPSAHIRLSVSPSVDDPSSSADVPSAAHPSVPIRLSVSPSVDDPSSSVDHPSPSAAHPSAPIRLSASPSVDDPSPSVDDPSSSPLSRLVVLVSGSGTNLQAILDACSSGELPAEVVAVISNKPAAYGLERARRAGIPAIAHPKPRDQDRREYDRELAALVSSYQPDWVVLAGWMRLLSAAFLDRFPGRVINLHPALPGAFPGTDAIQRAYNAYRQGEIQHTGVMVHLVPDEGVDSGPVLALETIPIHATDTLTALEDRIHTLEHRLLLDVLKKLTVKQKP